MSEDEFDAAIRAALAAADNLGYTAITTRSVTALIEAAAPHLHCRSCDGHSCDPARGTS